MIQKMLMALLLCAFCSGALAAGALTNFTINNSTASTHSSLTPPMPGYTDAIVLSANTQYTQNIPPVARWVVFSFPCVYWAIGGASVAVPGVSTTDGSAPMNSPAAWQIPPGTTQISVISTGACSGSLSFYN